VPAFWLLGLERDCRIFQGQTTEKILTTLLKDAGLAADQFDNLARDVAHHVKSMVGITVDVDVKPPGAIARSQGKAVRVRDLRATGSVNP
jgi:phenylacetate-coenzyme A ligase PaaK-like adenylate-forming protein